MWNKNNLTEVLKVQYPIIQGPFGGSFSSIELLTKVSNLGGLGSFGLNSYDSTQILAINDAIKRLTTKPYLLNLWVPFYQEEMEHYSLEQFEELKHRFKPYFDALEVDLPTFPVPKTQSFDAQIEAILKAKPPIVSFIFGIPDALILKELKQSAIKIIGTATTLEETKAIEAAQFDAVVASGIEAGGHRASFLDLPENSTLSTKGLVKELIGNIDLPIIAAGGIANGKEIIQMMRLGAQGVQMGTAFLATQSSNASLLHKELLRSPKGLNTSLTKVFTGRLARALTDNLSKNFLEEKVVAPYPIQSLFLSSLRKKSLEKKEFSYNAFWSGQLSVPLRHERVEDLFSALLREIAKN